MHTGHSRLMTLFVVAILGFCLYQLCVGPLPEKPLTPREIKEGTEEAAQFERDKICFKKLLQIIQQQDFRQLQIYFGRDNLSFSCYYEKEKIGTAEALIRVETEKPEHELFPASIRRMIQILEDARLLHSARNREEKKDVIQQISLLNKELSTEDLERIFNEAVKYWEFRGRHIIY